MGKADKRNTSQKQDDAATNQDADEKAANPTTEEDTAKDDKDEEKGGSGKKDAKDDGDKAQKDDANEDNKMNIDEKAADDKNDETSKKRGRSEKEEEEEADEKPAPSSSSGREKRARKSAVAYKPEDFSQVDHSPHVIDGQGTTLSDLEKVKDSIESYKDNAEELTMAYRLLFAARGRVNPKDVKKTLLQFNGYLPKPEEGATEKETEKVETAAEKKYSQKAYKLKVAQIKKLCDVFALDRQGLTDKDSLIDLLLDFLSKPSDELVKGSEKGAKKKPSKGKKKRKGDKDDESEEEEESEDEIAEGDMPNDKQLRRWVRAYVRCFNTSDKTLKDAMKIAEEKFGVSLKEKKDKIKQLLTEEI